MRDRKTWRDREAAEAVRILLHVESPKTALKFGDKSPTVLIYLQKRCIILEIAGGGVGDYV